MYLRLVKTAVVEAIRSTLNERYPKDDYRNLFCDIEYPIEEPNYPGIWVDYDDTESLKIAGIDHIEWIGTRPHTRWKFSGVVTLTCVALSSNERDRLYDEMITILAFGRENPQRSIFRKTIENHDFIAMNINFDVIEPRGSVAAPGTPWGTDDMIFERTLNLSIVGEFFTDEAAELLALSGIDLIVETDLDLPPGSPLLTHPVPSALPNPSLTDWT